MSTQNKLKEYNAFIQYLPEVKAYIAELEHQDLWWSTVGMVGKINNENIDSQLLESIVETQKEFQNLRDIMIEELIGRYLNQANSEIMLKAQTTIDILIRNLFERTADVGFLATDDDIVEYMANTDSSPSDAAFIDQRIQEYVAKYSVYNDILLVTPTGDIKAKLNKSNPVEHSLDPLINHTLKTNDDYVEIYRYSDLFPNQPVSLIYAKKITQVSESGGTKDVGVLCLSFSFEDEMQGIFNTLNINSEHGLMLLNQNAEIIASNSPKKHPVGQRIRALSDTTKPEKNGNNLRFSIKTTGYQEFYGLPWQGYVDIDVNQAFAKRTTNDLGVKIPKESPLYLHALEEVNIKVSTLLLTVILNGKIMSLKRKVQSFLPILDRFQIISLEIQEIFSRFIHHIHQVLVDTIQSKVAFSATLAVEIMDRNLYERANDCRWWALNSSFRKILSDKHNNGSISHTQSQKLTDILEYINSLYTVYTNIILYDANGEILAVSNKAESDLVGTLLPRRNDTTRCLSLHDTQSYIVSDFHKTELYGNDYSYIYHAVVKDWENMEKNVGGIALVFDSTPEFKAMLDDTEPKYLNDSINKTTFSAFVDRDGQVISSTSQEFAINDIIDIPKEVLLAPNGQNDCFAWKWNNTTYLVGYKVSSGYREYKNGDGYTNDVIALVFTGI
ncbi:hypothetical protein THMIRHAM_13220 [Thiomicrorhabdus immobilis]|uniref:Chemotaxis protein CheW n=1 Tax=Thiomicrorhabdus immobilis TaxID=2791037 RepID=A0ABM7MDN5_9GAMM|nr:cache domain-containing protein [Thiomicrorhabdus immobilis]BCN93537.1 hypothetical protein THMIRHAM_13220 [Thiomicrorhabdus immobilis]